MRGIRDTIGLSGANPIDAIVVGAEIKKNLPIDCHALKVGVDALEKPKLMIFEKQVGFGFGAKNAAAPSPARSERFDRRPNGAQGISINRKMLKLMAPDFLFGTAAGWNVGSETNRRRHEMLDASSGDAHIRRAVLTGDNIGGKLDGKRSARNIIAENMGILAIAMGLSVRGGAKRANAQGAVDSRSRNASLINNFWRRARAISPCGR